MKILDVGGCLATFKELVWLTIKSGGNDAVSMKHKYKATLTFAKTTTHVVFENLSFALYLCFMDTASLPPL